MECVKEAVCSCNDCLLESIELYGGISIFLIGVAIILIVSLLIKHVELMEVWK